MQTLLTLAAAEPAGGAATSEIVLATAGALVATAILFVIALGQRSGRVTILNGVLAFAERRSGLPGWVALPSGLSAVALIVALFGMYWDISLHIDVGRDAGPLANPAHYFILVGLFGIFAAGVLAIALSPDNPSPYAVKLSPNWHAPLGGLLMLACAGFALTGFPLDDMWHRLFGQDVTLWGPTHLMLIGGASLALIGQLVLLREGGMARKKEGIEQRRPTWEYKLRYIAAFGGLMIGLSTFQAEFDFGVPQFRFIFQPMLIVLAAGIGLVAARVAGGPGTALAAVVFFWVVRGIISVLVGPVLGETTPHLPLYFAEAAIVELVAMRVSRNDALKLGAIAGLLIGTVGFAAEWGWSHIWSAQPWPAALLPETLWLVPLMAVAAGLIGGWVGACLRGERATANGAHRRLIPAAGLVVAGLIAFGLVTSKPTDTKANVTLAQIEGGKERTVKATVRVDPPGRADNPEWLQVTAWQGDGLVVDHLRKVSPGVYETTEPIPVYGNWKALIRLHDGNALLAVPLYLPEDTAIPAKGVPASPRFTRTFTDDKTILQREAKDTSPLLSLFGYGVVLAIAISLILLLGWGLRRVARPPEGRQKPPAPSVGAPEREKAPAPGPVLPA